MRLKPAQLARHLGGDELRPIYVVSGDEPLQLGEVADAVRAAARARGFGDREVFDVGASFDWSALSHSADSLSLFAARRILDLRLPSGRPGNEGAAALGRYAAAPPPDTLLLVSTCKLDGRSMSTRWFKALDAAGAVIQVWPVEPSALPAWIERRAAAAGVSLTSEAAAALAGRVEGNLLACVQEIEKLRLLHGGERVDVDQIHASVADSARFDVFDLVDAALAGDARRTVRTLAGLAEEGVYPLPVLGAVAWALRAVAGMARDVAAGADPDQVIRRQRGGNWMRRREGVVAALARHRPEAWLEMIEQAARVDRVTKGAPGNPWDELERLCLAICGIPLPAGPPR